VSAYSGVTPYYRANDQERAAAWQRLEALQQEVGRRMVEKGITEDDIDRVLQEDD
jgi:isopentenyl diphosphate isomerase/L-lactate dehydrogenase-like FMN-dependent dehydrogenase